MKIAIFYGFVTLFCFYVSVTSAQQKQVFCYYGSWAKYRRGNGNFNIANLKSSLCDVVIYAFLGLNNNLNLDTGGALEDLSTLVKLKATNSKLKVLIAIGGWNEGSDRFSRAVSTSASRQSLVNSIYKFVKDNSLDGVDLDWEYPAQRGGLPIDKSNFVLFLQQLREKLSPENLLITAAVGGPASIIDASYDVPNLNLYLDYINVMAYDLHGVWNQQTGQNAPLYPPTNKPYDLNVDAVIKGWIQAGASPSKLILGLGFYGRTYTLASSVNNGVGVPIIGAGPPGEYTGEGGILSYLEICEALRSGGYTAVWDTVQKTPYAFKGQTWIGYDDARSIKIKSEYVVEQKLAGAMVWTIDFEDVNNYCGQGVYPLLSVINEVFSAAGSGPTVKPASPTQPPSKSPAQPPAQPPVQPPAQSPSETTTQTSIPPTQTIPSTTQSPVSGLPSTIPNSPALWNQEQADLACKIYGNPLPICNPIGQCTQSFIWCIRLNNGNFLSHFDKCADSLVFDEKRYVCDFPRNVDACNAK